MILQTYISGLLTVLVVFTFAFSGYQVAEAADPLETDIEYVTGNGSLVMSPGERMDVFVEFLNTGEQTWKNDGPGYVSMYTYEPKYRGSAFDPGTWLWGDQVSRIREATVAPGGTGTMLFELKAPETPGIYEEVFHLASEDTAWITGGELRLKIEVREGGQENVVADAVTVGQESEQSAAGISGTLKVKSANQVKATAGSSILFTVAFENTGTKTWQSYGLALPDVAIASEASDFSHPSWSGSQLAYINDTPVAPGELAIVAFSFSAPEVNGSHTASFQFEANGVDLPSGSVEIPIEVTGGSVSAIPQTDTAVDTATYIDEPNIRVGVLIVDEETDNEIQITSLESNFNVRDVKGNLLAELSAGDVVTAYYDGKYHFDRGRGFETSSYALRFEPAVEHAVMRIANWDKRLTRGSVYADNEFRGVLEFQHNDYKDRAWVINELGLDHYLRGLAETSNSHELAMNQAQVTAARSYAYFYIVSGGKRAKEFMDLNSTPSDQYYLGYGQEKRGTEIVEAVEDTRGQVVMYDGQVAITPYYARSNGSTKDWSQVWWGDRPYAKGVSVPCDVGKTQWGHGVGMPQSGAQCMAEDGATWQEIIEYFYTGIEIKKLWK